MYSQDVVYPLHCRLKCLHHKRILHVLAQDDQLANAACALVGRESSPVNPSPYGLGGEELPEYGCQSLVSANLSPLLVRLTLYFARL